MEMERHSRDYAVTKQITIKSELKSGEVQVQK